VCITEDIRKYAEENGLKTAEALQAGMDEKALKYRNTTVQISP
jgi:hypothetical protein